jgi:hypothetical protein
MQGVYDIGLNVANAQGTDLGESFQFVFAKSWPACDISQGGIDPALGVPVFNRTINPNIEALPVHLVMPQNLVIGPHPTHPQSQLVALHTDARF